MGEVQDPISFGDIKAAVKNMTDRGRDSTLDDTIVGQAINGAEQFICLELGGNAKFLEDTESITIPANTTGYTFRASVKDIISIRDEGNVWKVQEIDRERWNSYVVDPAFHTGSALFWTRFGFTRRTNEESPAQQYGQLKIEVTPAPTSETTLVVDEILRPGFMVDDEDMPVLPAEYHWGLQEWSAYFLGPRDIGRKSFEQHERLANLWLTSIRRSEIRNLAGNQRFIPREGHDRLAGSNAAISPPTRLGQLYGGS